MYHDIGGCENSATTPVADFLCLGLYDIAAHYMRMLRGEISKERPAGQRDAEYCPVPRLFAEEPAFYMRPYADRRTGQFPAAITNLIKDNLTGWCISLDISQNVNGTVGISFFNDCSLIHRHECTSMTYNIIIPINFNN